MDFRNKLKWCWLFISLILLITLGAGSVRPVLAQDPSDDTPWVDPALLAKSARSTSFDFLIHFEAHADLSLAYTLPWQERGWYVYETLSTLADETQVDVRAYLDQQGVVYEPFWINNTIAVENSTRSTLDGLLSFGEIDSLRSITYVQLDVTEVNPSPLISTQDSNATSNLRHINADGAWASGYTGEGMVVGSIDTGVRFTHETLINSYRGALGSNTFNHNYNWWDAVNGSKTAIDDHWHGTHTTGIMVGATATNQTGVAPGAQWIACKGLNSQGSGNDVGLTECGQFMLAPWNLNQQSPNPDLRPQVVNNSWGACASSYQGWYQGIINAWQAAGIYPIFANGNGGVNGCGTVGLNTVNNPARAGNVTGVGSTGTSNGAYASHSLWGPTDNPDTINPRGYPNMKPQVVAPGVAIISATNSGDNAYVSGTGTSMSAPHVAGLIALMWQAGFCLVGDYATTETLLETSATPIPYNTGSGLTSPNYATGWGEIDALAAVRAARDTCGDSALEGVVRSSLSNAPLAWATVTATANDGFGFARSVFTDSNGYYHLQAFSGHTYTLTVTMPFFEIGTVTNVVVTTPGSVVRTNFSLTELHFRNSYLPLIFH